MNVVTAVLALLGQYRRRCRPTAARDEMGACTLGCRGQQLRRQTGLRFLSRSDASLMAECQSKAGCQNVSHLLMHHLMSEREELHIFTTQKYMEKNRLISHAYIRKLTIFYRQHVTPHSINTRRSLGHQGSSTCIAQLSV